MQPAITTPMTVEEFEAFASQPENVERRLEFIGEEMVEVVSSRKPSRITGLLFIKIGNFVLAHQLGELTVPDGGYKVGKNRFMPDIAFVSQSRLPADSDEQVWLNIAPDLAVEVLSPTDRPHLVRLKLSAYLAAGTTVWLIDPDIPVLEVHAPGQPPQTFKAQDTLTGGTVLPGFSLSLAEVFA